MITGKAKYLNRYYSSEAETQKLDHMFSRLTLSLPYYFHLNIQHPFVAIVCTAFIICIHL